jgi:hypothetical protein
MMDDFKVAPRSAKDIEALTLAWRDALGVPGRVDAKYGAFA